MRKVVSLVLALAVIVPASLVARGAMADSVEQRLARARARHDAASEAVAKAEGHLARVVAAYRGLQAKLNQAAKETVVADAAQEELSRQLAEARERLNERVTTAYEIGPAASLDVFLGAQSAADFASAQVYAANTFEVDDSLVTEVTTLKARLADSIAGLQAKQQDLGGSVSRVESLAAEAAADVADARTKAGATGSDVKRLERQLAAARAAAAAALSQYLGSGGIGATCASGPVHDLIVDSFSSLGQAQVDTALAVATRESNCRPDAYNQTVVPPYGNASGVFQILAPGIWDAWSAQCGYQGASPFDPKANVAVAACVVADQGWWPWGF